MENNLAKVATLNDAAVAAFETFSGRQRFRSNTNLRRFHRELEDKYGKIDEKQLIETFKSLQDAGMGSLIVGRNKSKTRFAWNYSLRDVAKLAKGEVNPDEVVKITKPVRRYIRPTPIQQPQTPAPIAQSDNETEVMVVNGDGKLHKYAVAPEKMGAFKALLESLAQTR